ncbi:glycosyltransferase family 4 protein [Rhizobium sp. YS-1r]|uniref:Glycosyltransferase family 4 protein n=1 Tax=Neorhizobium phenanthreniclasticum TaxID=3157917 RepID=A0ABV0M5R5_9HYPH|nr:glycosyltransferase family 4 protein [Rhizobium sp. YS-1r]KGD96863.1 glycosyl transferase [Rhizobium sp. YS-1r]
MKIAFYSPLKPPGHPVPSGDRLMARLLIQALTLAGYDIEIASEFRSFMPTASNSSFAERRQAAQAEIARLEEGWTSGGQPDLWFCYHPYYKAPDLLGPALCQHFGLPYVTAEASYSLRRNEGAWVLSQEAVLSAVQMAAVNLCFTGRDERGLRAVAPQGRFERLPAFIDPAPFLVHEPRPEPFRLITVAMMRPGDKLDSYRTLAESLRLLQHLPWTLDVIGDGPARAEVEVAFGFLTPERIRWHGVKTADEIAELLSAASLYVWPGHGEAYGLAYLEAQAAGLPVIAEETAGVPEVVVSGRTGLLMSAGDVSAYAAAIERLLTSGAERQAMAVEARRFASNERSVDRAAIRLQDILARYIGASS